MFHAAGELCRCVLFGLPLEECWIILEHERARRATGHDRLVRRQGGKVIAGAFGDEAGMPVGLDRGPRAALRRERRFDPMPSEDGDDRVAHAIIEVVGRASVEVGDPPPVGGAGVPRQLGIPVAQVPDRQAREHHLARNAGGAGDAAQKRPRQPFQPGQRPAIRCLRPSASSIPAPQYMAPPHSAITVVPCRRALRSDPSIERFAARSAARSSG